MDKEKLIYLVKYTGYYINSLVDNVLQNSPTDPHYSATTATNLIKCYIQVLNDIGETQPYKNVSEYLKFYDYSEEEISIFEENKVRESEYYCGEQF